MASASLSSAGLYPNFFAASIGAMRMSVSGRSAGDQASIRTEELFWLLKIEAGAI
jgi:hypothetical protein